MYKTIAPYNQEEIQKALMWLSGQKQFFKGVQYFHPKWSTNEVIEKLKSCNSCSDFQVSFIEPLIKNLIYKSIDNLEVKGLETIKKEDNHLYISNHRDIFLDSALLQYTLYHRGYFFTEISLGDNLIVNEVMEKVAKLNNMFTVFRKGTKTQRLKNAIELSSYLRYAITQKKVSAWIAQGNGRTKNGNDVTSPGLINMLLMSDKGDVKKAIESLNIVVSSISFEYEPCAVEKAIELQTIQDTGIYEKKQFENINSIVKGIEEQKGGVCLHLEKLNTANIDFSENKKKITLSIAQEIDRIIYKNYKLFKTNYIAHDLLFNTKSFKKKYTKEEKKDFEAMIKQISKDKCIQKRILNIYMTPIMNIGSEKLNKK